MSGEDGAQTVVRRDGSVWRWEYVEPANEPSKAFRLSSSIGFVNQSEAEEDARAAYPEVPLRVEGAPPEPDLVPGARSEGRRLLRFLARVTIFVLMMIWLWYSNRQAHRPPT